MPNPNPDSTSRSDAAEPQTLDESRVPASPPWRLHLALILIGFAIVLAIWGGNLYTRHLQAVAHPEDDNASGGMYAFAEALSNLFSACLLMVPTLFLIRFLSRFETIYTAFSKLLFWLSATMPVIVVASYVARSTQFMGDLMVLRVLASPFCVTGMAFSRLVARTGLTRSLTLRALLIEAGGLAMAMSLLTFGH